MKLLHGPRRWGGLHIAPSPRGVAFKGVVHGRDPASWLGPRIDELHAAALRERVAEVEVDLRRLESANAATWKCFVYWLKRITDDDARYRLHFLCEEAHRWQEMGTSKLRVFGGDRVRVTTWRGEREV